MESCIIFFSISIAQNNMQRQIINITYVLDQSTFDYNYKIKLQINFLS